MSKQQFLGSSLGNYTRKQPKSVAGGGWSRTAQPHGESLYQHPTPYMDAHPDLLPGYLPEQASFHHHAMSSPLYGMDYGPGLDEGPGIMGGLEGMGPHAMDATRWERSMAPNDSAYDFSQGPPAGDFMDEYDAAGAAVLHAGMHDEYIDAYTPMPQMGRPDAFGEMSPMHVGGPGPGEYPMGQPGFDQGPFGMPDPHGIGPPDFGQDPFGHGMGMGAEHDPRMDHELQLQLMHEADQEMMNSTWQNPLYNN